MKKRLIPVVLIVAVSAIAISAISFRSGKSDNRLRLSGNIEVDEVEVAFQIPGRVVERLVSEGQQVQRGQLVARLDDTELQHEAAARRADLEAAVATFDKLKNGSRPEEIAQARAALRSAQADAARASSDFTRQRELLDDDVISKREYDNCEAAARTSSARVDEARQRLALLERGNRAEDIEQARAKVDQARQASDGVATRLGFSTLLSPIGGVVLEDHVEPGEMVAAGTPVVAAANLSTVWLRAYVPETDLGRVHIGQPVKITTDTYPGKSYSGRVSFISSDAEFTPKQVQTAKERVKLVYRIKIDVANPAFELKPGMPADAEIEVAK